MNLSEKYQQFWVSGDQKLADEIFDSNLAYTFNQIKVQGRKAVVNHILERKKDYEVHYRISDICTTPELEYHRWKADAKLNKVFEDFPSTGQHFSYSGLTLLKTKKDQIIEILMYSDIDEVLKKKEI